MRKDDVGQLFDYLYWVRDQVLRAAARLPADAFTSWETVTTRDLRATLVHELDVQWSWRERLRSGSFPEGDDLQAEHYESVAAVAEHWRRDEAEMRAWLAGLTDEELSVPPPAEAAGLPLWHYAMHLFTHGMQQFSEAAVLLTRAGESPGDLGFLEFANKPDRHRA